MDDPKPSDQYSDASAEHLPLASTFGEQEKQTWINDKPSASESGDGPPQGSVWARWQRHSLSERIMAYFTGVVAICAALQIWILIGGSGQTQQLIAAANINAKASHDFAETADKINMKVGEAVDKLNLQADKLEASVRQANRLANETHIANENVLEADRPWFGITGDVIDFEVGHIPRAVFRYTNSGKRPARTTTAATQAGIFKDFPGDPPYSGAPDIHSNSFVVPGGTITNSLYLFPEPLTQDTVDSMNQKSINLYIYAKVEYIDPRTREVHFTHFCLQYSPPVPGRDKGFYNCGHYNDGN